MLKDFASSIVQTLRQRGFQAYLVGGCVRDLLLGREPKDYDVATDATPQQVMEIFPETYAVGAQFGVVLVPALAGEGEGDPATDRRRDRMQWKSRPSAATSDTPTAATRTKCDSAGNQRKTWLAATSRSTACCLIR